MIVALEKEANDIHKHNEVKYRLADISLHPSCATSQPPSVQATVPNLATSQTSPSKIPHVENGNDTAVIKETTNRRGEDSHDNQVPTLDVDQPTVTPDRQPSTISSESGDRANGGGDEKNVAVDPSALTTIVSDLSDVLDSSGATRAIHKCEVYLNMMMDKATEGQSLTKVTPRGSDAFSRLIPLVDTLVDLLDTNQESHRRILSKTETFLLDTLQKAEKDGQQVAAPPMKKHKA